jgi:uncharacterized protein YjbI with pentapeptide repeats
MKIIAICAVLAAACVPSRAEEVTLKAEKAVVITFPSQQERTYNVLGAESAAGPWRSLQDGIAGTGGEVTVFYKSETDQKLFFKVEGRQGSPVSPARETFESLARLNLSKQNFTGQQYPGENFNLFTLSGTIFNNANLKNASFLGATGDQASFANADLRGILTDQDTHFENASFAGANLEGTRLSGHMDAADFRNARLTNAVVFISAQYADFRGAQLAGTVFVFANLVGANFSGQNLSNVTFHYTQLGGADFTGASLAGADLSRSYLVGTKLDGATLANANLEGIVADYISFAGRDLRGSLLRGSVLSRESADWSGINAAGVDASLAVSSSLRSLNLSAANFAGANLEGVILKGADLSGANLRNAKLQGAELKGANLSNVDFTGADLSFADVSSANLTGATGFNAEQPGMQFSSSLSAYYGGGTGGGGGTQGTVLPDGTTRTGTNPGTAFAPATAPARLRFDINDFGTVSTRELAFNANGYSEAGQVRGPFTYAAKAMIADLALTLPGQTAPTDYYTLLFTSPTGGKLFKNGRNGIFGVFLIGTFTVLP